MFATKFARHAHIPKPQASFVRHAHSEVIIVGGGTAGMTAAAQLPLREFCQPSQITVFDPSPTHRYQPGYTMVAGGLLGGTDKEVDKYESDIFHRQIRSVFDSGVKLVSESIEEYDPDNNAVITASGERFSYNYLIVAPGIELRFDMVPGLQEALDDPDHPCGSMYQWDYAKKINRYRAQFRGGKCVAVQPPMPIKCGGAPQKWVYLAEDSFTTNGIRRDVDFQFYSATPGIFPVKKYAEKLTELMAEKNIKTNFAHAIQRVDPTTQTVYFKDGDGNQVAVDYDLLHVPPPQRAPQSISNSPLADESGFVDVNPATLQSKKYRNVFGIGDATNTPNAKTAAAVFAQTPVVIQNMSQVKNQNDNNLNGIYDGYGACPIFTGNGKLILAEFVYGNVDKETFPWDQSKANQLQFYLKRHVFPWAYWNLTPRGKWYGTSGMKPPKFDAVAKPAEEAEAQAK